MTFEERYNLKTIQVGGFLLMQKSPSFWCTGTGNVTDSYVIFVTFNEERQAWHACAENEDDFVQFRSKSLNEAKAMLFAFLRAYKRRGWCSEPML